MWVCDAFAMCVDNTIRIGNLVVQLSLWSSHVKKREEIFVYLCAYGMLVVVLFN